MARPKLMRSFVRSCPRGCAVEEISSSLNRFSPHVEAELLAMEHGTYTFNQCAVLALRAPVLLWSVWACKLVANTLIGKELYKLSTQKLAASITSNLLNAIAGLLRYKLAEFLEAIQNVRLVFDTVDKPVAGEVVLKEKKITGLA